jgi:hypothetical protein
VTDGIIVNRDVILAGISGLHQTATALDAAQQEFNAKVQSLVEPPGLDLISPLIWAAHGAVLPVLQQCVASNAHGIRTHAEKWATAQKIHDMVEKVTAGELGRVRGELR